MNCSRIDSTTSYKNHGCINCPQLGIKQQADIYDATSDSFKGMICMFKNEKSWVAKWQRINGCKKGVYAIVIDGVLPDEYINRVEESGNVYHQRDKSFSA